MTTPSGHVARVSTGKQDEAAQVPDNMAWIGARDYDLTQTYTIHGRSAFKGNRAFDAAWQGVLADMKSGKIRVLVVWKQDRIDRKLHTFQMLEQVVDAGGRVEFVTQPHLNDLTTMGGRISLKVQEEIAYAESKDKSDRVKAHHAGLRNTGALTGKQAWGYEPIGEKGHRQLVPTDDGRIYIPIIFARCVEGWSLARIAAWLDSEGVRPAIGETWWAKSVGEIIRNTTYTGRRQDKAGNTIHRCEPLVDAATFRRAGEALGSRPKRGPANAANRAMLAEVLACPLCQDSPMYRIMCGGPRAAKSAYYRCAGRGSQRRGCGNMTKVSTVDALVSDFMGNFDGPIVDEVFVPGHDHAAELESVKLDIRSLDPDDADYDQQHAELRAELARLRDLPKTDDRIEYVPTGRTYAGQWAALEAADRAAWLKANHVRVYALNSKMATLLENRNAPGTPTLAGGFGFPAAVRAG